MPVCAPHPTIRAHVVRAAWLAAALPWLAGCATTIVPPTAPAEPVSIFVLDHGQHASLVLPLEPAGAVRYSYGDWDWYALDRTGFGSGMRALFRPTQGALGRKLLSGPPSAESLARQLQVAIEDNIELRVEADAARRLVRELEALYQSARATRHYSAAYDMEFVHHPIPYTLGHNSNLVVARWLEELGCTVRGRPVLSDWRVAR